MVAKSLKEQNPKVADGDVQAEIASNSASEDHPDLAGLIDEILSAPDGSGSNRIAGVEVIDRYPDTQRVRAVQVAERILTDNQYRRFLALRRGLLASGTSEDVIDLGEVADEALKLTATRSARAIPGATVGERDRLGRPATWIIDGRTLTQRQYGKLRKRYFA